MSVDRRDFLKIAGVSAAGLAAAKPVADLLFGSSEANAETAHKPTKPLIEGSRWAMVVIASKLTEEDIHHAIEACHKEHNVPDIRLENGQPNIKEEIKWIWGDHFHNIFPEQAGEFDGEIASNMEFILMCNHCTDPPCCRVCPTQATFKREKDGIVVMDMHRCIGCRFCMAGCPYGSRSFNWSDPRQYLKTEDINPKYPTRTKGVVEKCNFCAERLFKGLQPACVEACKNGGLVFGDLDSPESEVRELLRTHHAIRRKPSLGTGPNVYYII